MHHSVGLGSLAPRFLSIERHSWWSSEEAHHEQRNRQSRCQPRRDARPDERHDAADIEIGGFVAHGGPPRYSTRSGALSIRTVEPGSRARPSGPFADGFTESDHGALATSENLPVDELLERRVDPGLHLGFLPVLPEPSG